MIIIVTIFYLDTYNVSMKIESKKIEVQIIVIVGGRKRKRIYTMETDNDGAKWYYQTAVGMAIASWLEVDSDEAAELEEMYLNLGK